MTYIGPKTAHSIQSCQSVSDVSVFLLHNNAGPGPTLKLMLSDSFAMWGEKGKEKP